MIFCNVFKSAWFTPFFTFYYNFVLEITILKSSIQKEKNSKHFHQMFDSLNCKSSVSRNITSTKPIFKLDRVHKTHPKTLYIFTLPSRSPLSSLSTTPSNPYLSVPCPYPSPCHTFSPLTSTFRAGLSLMPSRADAMKGLGLFRFTVALVLGFLWGTVGMVVAGSHISCL